MIGIYSIYSKSHTGGKFEEGAYKNSSGLNGIGAKCVCLSSLKFEVDAGYYECKNCHHKFVPIYKEVMFSINMGTTRHLRCPECKKRSWAKKVMAK